MQRYLNRAVNERHTGHVMAGMVLLLALCGWVSAGENGLRWAIAESRPRGGSLKLSPETMRRLFGARLLSAHEMPALFEILKGVCQKAGLDRLPDLYYIDAPDSMNAYALGGPEGSAITLTEGLLRGMTRGEIAAILAHEIAHIRNNDGGTMHWAATLQQLTTLASLFGLFSLQALGRSYAAPSLPLAALVGWAPAIGRLLLLALSRIRELDADALALELIDDPHDLMAALDKLERHHGGASAFAADASLVAFLRSHPATWERVGILSRLA